MLHMKRASRSCFHQLSQNRISMYLHAMPSYVLLSSDDMAGLWLNIMCVNMCSYAFDKELCKGKVPKKKRNKFNENYISHYICAFIFYMPCRNAGRAFQQQRLALPGWLAAEETEETTPCGAMNVDAYDEWELYEKKYSEIFFEAHSVYTWTYVFFISHHVILCKYLKTLKFLLPFHIWISQLNMGARCCTTNTLTFSHRAYFDWKLFEYLKEYMSCQALISIALPLRARCSPTGGHTWWNTFLS